MPQFNVHDAKTQFSKLLEIVETGEEVIIARHAKAVARLVRVEENNILGSGVGDPITVQIYPTRRRFRR